MAVGLLSHAESAHSQRRSRVFRARAQTGTWQQAEEEARKLEAARDARKTASTLAALCSENVRLRIWLSFAPPGAMAPPPRKHERLVGFVEFCIGNDWLDKNPAVKMKKAEEKARSDRLFHS
jgi:hypothetical protein